MAALMIRTMNNTRSPIAGLRVSDNLRIIQPRCRIRGTHPRWRRTPASGILEFRSPVFIGFQHAFDLVACIADFAGPSALGLHELGRVRAAPDGLSKCVRHALLRQREPA